MGLTNVHRNWNASCCIDFETFGKICGKKSSESDNLFSSNIWAGHIKQMFFLRFQFVVMEIFSQVEENTGRW